MNTCKNCDRTGHWAKDCWRPGGGAYDNPIRNNSYTQKGKNHTKGKGKSKHVDVVETNQSSETVSTVSYPSQTPRTIGELLCNSNVEPWIMGVTINSVSTRRQAGAECLLLDSGAQLHACPIMCPGQKKVPLPDPGIHTASGARRHHEGGRLLTYKLPQGLTIRVLFFTRVQFRNQFCLLVVTLKKGTGVIFVQTLALFFLKHSHTQMHKEESLFFVKGMLVAPLSTAGVSDEVAQQMQMPMDRKCRRTLRSGCLLVLHSRSNRDGTAQSDTFSESVLMQDVHRISRTRFTTSRTTENRRSRASTSV